MVFIDHWRPDVVLQAIQDERIPYFGAVPTMFAMILSMRELGNYDLSSLKLLITAGERLNPELIVRMKRLCEKNSRWLWLHRNHGIRHLLQA